MKALTDAERHFLQRAMNMQSIGPADRVNDKIRQKCRKLGLVVFDRSDRIWKITKQGLQVLGQNK